MSEEIIKIPRKKLIVGVVGGNRVEIPIYNQALIIGRGIAEAGYILVTGGLGGVMEAASKGAFESGGMTVGVLPGSSRTEANPYVSIPVVTSMSHARNAIIVRTADIIVAISGRYGTLSEIALAKALNKRVLGFYTWGDIPGVESFDSPEDILKELKKFAGADSES